MILGGDEDPARLVESICTESTRSVNICYIGPEDELPRSLSELMVEYGSDDDARLVVFVVDPMMFSEADGERQSGVVSSLVQDLRPFLELGGGRIVLVTVDDRSPWHPAPRDMGSTVASATFYAHQRYRVERDQVLVIKDEREGRSGRILWSWYKRVEDIAVGDFVDLAL